MDSRISTEQDAVSLGRRDFIKHQLQGMVGLALMPARGSMGRAAAVMSSVAALGATTACASKPEVLKPQQQPAAFVSIAADGTTTIVCNRLEMGQGAATGLAMALADELDADWPRVRTGFGDQRPAYVDPVAGIHMTGGSNSIKNSFQQYRELGARLRAMLLSAAAAQWGVPVAELSTEPGAVVGPAAAAGALASTAQGGQRRRASYGALFDAAIKLPVPAKVALKDPAQFRLIGQPVAQTSLAAKVDGSLVYGIDLSLPGLLTAVIARPPVFGGGYKSLDAADAMAVPGVKAVLPVALDRGAQGVAVVATSTWAALQGRKALKLVWGEPDTAQTMSDTQAQLIDYLARAKQPGKPVADKRLQQGPQTMASGGEGAAQTLTAEFSFPYLAHAPMEPLCCTVHLQANAPQPRCLIYTASQMPGSDVQAVAKACGIPAEQVQIHVMPAGGGFGRRAVPGGEYVVEAVRVAQAFAALKDVRSDVRSDGSASLPPIKLLRTREDDLQAGYYRPLTVHRATLQFSATAITGWQHVIVSQSIVQGTPFEAFLMNDGVDAMSHEGMAAYDVPMRVSVHHPQGPVPVLWWRSVGSSHTAFVVETLVDEAADRLKIDPVAMRLQLLGNARPREKAALELAVAQAGYRSTRLREGQAWGVALHHSFDSVVAYVVLAQTLDAADAAASGGLPLQLLKVVAAVHCNRCVNPSAVKAQVEGSVAMALSTCLPGHAITLKNGVVQQRNLDQLPLLRLAQMPPVEVHIVSSDAPPTGMGEPALPPLAPAVANALRRLTGTPVRALPFG